MHSGRMSSAVHSIGMPAPRHRASRSMKRHRRVRNGLPVMLFVMRLKTSPIASLLLMKKVGCTMFLSTHQEFYKEPYCVHVPDGAYCVCKEAWKAESFEPVWKDVYCSYDVIHAWQREEP